MNPARKYAALGVAIGAGGLGSALWSGPRLLVAFCGVMWGATLMLAAFTWVGTGRSQVGLDVKAAFRRHLEALNRGAPPPP